MTERFTIHWVTTGDSTRSWIHTHGLADHGLPELEVRDIPAFLGEAVADLIRTVGNYMLDSGNEIHLCQTMATSDRTRFRFVKSEPIPGEEGHYEVERWQIVEVETPCDECGATPAELN